MGRVLTLMLTYGIMVAVRYAFIWADDNAFDPNNKTSDNGFEVRKLVVHNQRVGECFIWAGRC